MTHCHGTLPSKYQNVSCAVIALPPELVVFFTRARTRRPITIVKFPVRHSRREHGGSIAQHPCGALAPQASKLFILSRLVALLLYRMGKLLWRFGAPSGLWTGREFAGGYGCWAQRLHHQAAQRSSVHLHSTPSLGCATARHQRTCQRSMLESLARLAAQSCPLVYVTGLAAQAALQARGPHPRLPRSLCSAVVAASVGDPAAWAVQARHVRLLHRQHQALPH